MARARKKMFGPLFYSTLALALVATGAMQLESLRSKLAERQELERLVAALRETHPAGREAAAAELARRGDEVGVSRLLEATRDPRGEVRAVACRYLVESRADPLAVIPALTAAARDDQEAVRLEAACGVGRITRSAARIAWPSAGARGGLTTGLRRQGLEVLVGLVKDRSDAVRAETADSLGAFSPDPAAAAALVAATGDPERAVRLAAARSLLINWGRDRSAIRALLAIVADPEPIPDRAAALEALKVAGEEVLGQAVAAMAALLTCGDPAILLDVIDVLASLGPQARPALPALEGLVQDEDSGLLAVVGPAIAAIEDKGSPRSLAIFLKMIADPTAPFDQRLDAIDAVAEVKPAVLIEVTPRLIRQLGDPNRNVRCLANQLLAEIVPRTPAAMPQPAPPR
jgi:HEAT repeat protein